MTRPIRYRYHATFAKSLPAIQREGLTPNFDREPNFDGYPVDGKLFSADSEPGALFYATQLRELGEMVVLRFPSSMIRKADDPYGNPGDAWTQDTVPAEALDALVCGAWSKLSGMGRRSEGAGPSEPTSLIVGNLGVRLSDDGIYRAFDDEALVVVLVLRDGAIVDAATPAVEGREASVLALLNHIGLAARERATFILGRHGLRVGDDGKWFLDSPGMRPRSL